MKHRLEYYTLRLLITLCRPLPFSLLYPLSNFLAFFAQHFIRFQKKVVRINFKNSFPDKNLSQIKHLETQYYRHFTDLILETCKSFSMSKKNFIQRWKLCNPEITKLPSLQNKSLVVMSGHLANWEWGICAGEQVQKNCCDIYKPLHNKLIEKVVSKLRKRFSMHFAEQREFVSFIKETHKKNYIYMFFSDLRNLGKQKQKTIFLNQTTEFAMGAEIYAKRYDLPVIYLSIKRIKRGFYQATAQLITDKPKEMNTGEMTEKFAHLLEKDIQENPAHWLWGHRRWKGLYDYKTGLNIED